MENVFEDMLNSLKRHKGDRESILSDSVDMRLSKSLETYYKELKNSVEYLNSKDSYRVLKSSVRCR